MRTRRSTQLGKLVGQAERERRCIVATDERSRFCLRRAFLAGKLLSPLPHLYVRGDYWALLSPENQALHMMRALQLLHPSWVFAGPSAAVAHGLWVSRSYLLPPCIAVSRKTHSRNGSGVTRMVLGDVSASVIGGLRVTSLERTAFDCMRMASFQDGLAIADSTLRMGKWSREELCKRIRSMPRNCKGWEQAVRTASWADARAESGGESIARARMILLGYQVPDLQVELPDVVDGGNGYRCDFGWRLPDNTWVMGELDGREKYENPAMTGGRAATAVLADERLRESRISATGVRVMRFSFAEMMDDKRFCKLLDAYGVPHVSR